MSDEFVIKKEGVTIKRIAIDHCSFKRKPKINFDAATQTHQLGMLIQANKEGNRVATILQFSWDLSHDGESKASIEIVVVGVFEKESGSDIDIEQYARTKGANHVFPYLAQHVHYISTHASLTPIFLNPVDFSNAEAP